MKILITGNMGYVGSVLVQHLRSSFPKAILIGYDQGFFAHCLTGSSRIPESYIDHQIYGDIRNITKTILSEVDIVIHLAAISNDPMGKIFEELTDEINCKSSIELAKIAMNSGVKNFVFASSCSVYGASGVQKRIETDTLNPLTAYARSKISTEKFFSEWEQNSMTITSLRFSTACGLSDRLRLDLVLNDFVASAFVSKNITILSDGTPWRPLIDVMDMARAIEWAMLRRVGNGGPHLSINVGSDEWNFQVRDLAEAVASQIDQCTISINPNPSPDQRSYQVDFSLFRKLAPNHQPIIKPLQSIKKLVERFEKMVFKDTDFRNSDFIRLKVIKNHIKENRLSENLRWIS